MFERPTHAAIIAIAATAYACDPVPARSAADGAGAVTVRDSAGIEIVENHAAEHPAGRFWTIDHEPEIVLGGEENPDGEANDSSQLIWSVAGVARLEDGRVAILSSQGNRFLLFEPSGRLSRTIGRAGEGPGEFTRPEHLQYLPPDTLVVWDYFLSSIIRFDTAGRLIGERSIDFATMMERVPGVTGEGMELPLPDGSFVAYIRAPERDIEPVPGGITRLFGADFMRVGHDYAASPLASWAGMELWVPKTPMPSPFDYVPTIGPDLHIAAGGHPPSIYVSDGTNREIRQFSLDGTLIRLIRRTTDPVPVTAEARAAWEAGTYRIAEAAGEQPPPGLFDGMPVPEFFPSVSGMVVDSEGLLWVWEWTESQTGIPNQWSVYTSDGRWLGVVADPLNPAPVGLVAGCHWRYSPCWIDRDFLLAVRHGELGVERVEGYRIRRWE